MLDNTVTLVGNLTRDPELETTKSGTSFVRLGLAINRRKKVGDSWEDDDPFFFNLTAWEGLAENICDSLSKGDRVLVFGKLKYRTWENDENEKRSAVDVTVEDIGPALRWAQVGEITRVKSGGGGQRSDQPPAEAFDEAPFTEEEF